ncbi:MAG: hypothetical protein ACRC5C_05770 [Bacilli bacterium]
MTNKTKWSFFLIFLLIGFLSSTVYMNIQNSRSKEEKQVEEQFTVLKLNLYELLEDMDGNTAYELRISELVRQVEAIEKSTKNK